MGATGLGFNLLQSLISFFKSQFKQKLSTNRVLLRKRKTLVFVFGMASGKKASEGIALLSMYGEEEDDEMEDLEEHKQREQEEEGNPRNDAAVEEDDTVSNSVVASDSGTENTPWRQEERGGLNYNSTPNKILYYGGTSSATTTSQQPSLFSPQQQQFDGSDLNSIQSRKNMLTIVDYAHDEVAMSPEAEDGEIMESGQVKNGEELQMANGEFQEITSPGMVRIPTPSTQATPPQLLKQIDRPDSDVVNYAVNAAEAPDTEDTVMISAEEPKENDPLDKFLPPALKNKCSDELQEKIIRFLALKKTTGRSFNAEVRNRKEYRNPDFLLHAVTYQDIDQIGSCFSKDVFDPHGYDKSDFYDGIEADMRREMERKEQEKKKNQKVDFISGGTQPGIVVPTPKINMPIPGLAAVSGGAAQASADSVARDGRQNKKSKWDKVINNFYLVYRSFGKFDFLYDKSSAFF
ncbi:transcriptional regulator family [Olea europaea subsp. europaea]|uniref:Transcriptional regulator family n=1 Tax=Olea europaea subsp. europaea TaxID=158383 RepID=A0A8S0V277_OLEEU|nr:transcriptional regulator family [Olea europaea subsp. europaea]